MSDAESQKPLQEVVYKPTSESNIPGALKAESESSNSFLYFTVSIINLIGFTAGITFGWTSPVLPKLSQIGNDSSNPLDYAINSTEASWIAGLINLGAMFGPVIAGAVADSLGRKLTLFFISLPLLTSYLVLAYAKTITLFYACRVLLGVSIGSAFTVLPIYLAELAENHNRGTLGCSLGIFISSGLLFAFTVGPFLSIKNFCLISAVPGLVFVPIFLLWIPETPQFLASINKDRKLEKTLCKLRNKSPLEVQNEVSEICKCVIEDSRNKGSILELVKTRSLRRGIIVTLGAVLLQQFSGINAVLAYMQTIFEATESGLSPETSTIVVGAVQVCTTIVTTVLVDKLGRRILLLTSSIGSSFSLISLGVFFYLKDLKFDTSFISWLPVASLLAFIVLFNIGLGPIPWAVMAELFPSNFKSVASTVTSVVCFSASFLTTLFFPKLILMIGMAKALWIFGGVCFFGSGFIFWFLPETKGKSVQEIQRMLEGKKQ